MTETVNEAWNKFLDFLGERDESLLELLDCPLESFLDEQQWADRLRSNKRFKREKMYQIVRLYIEKLDVYTLKDKLKEKGHLFRRVLDKAPLFHLQLLVDLKIILEEKKPRRGLLAS